MGRKIAAFFTALNRPASHLLVLLSFSETIARGEGENYTVYNYYWQFFGNDSNLRQERKKNSIKILIHVNMQTRDVAFVSLSLLCGDNSRDFPRVVTFRAVCRSVSTLGERISEKGGLSTIFHSALGEEI